LLKLKYALDKQLMVDEYMQMVYMKYYQNSTN